VPDTLRPIIYHNQAKLYNLLFLSVAETLKELCADKKYLGAVLGFTAVLHSWGANLSFHPHIHCIVPAGGLTKLGSWVSSGKKFFIPVKVLSRKFKGKFLHYFKSQRLEFFAKQEYLSDPLHFQNLIAACYFKDWVIYCKPPFKSPAGVVEYLGRYTHRVAISNNRILKLEHGRVTFKWRDYRDDNKWKEMTISAFEFIRRFLMHVLPAGFMKIRHFGLLANRDKTKRLTLCKKLTNTPVVIKVKASTIDLIGRFLGRDLSLCLHCGNPRHPMACHRPCPHKTSISIINNAHLGRGKPCLFYHFPAIILQSPSFSFQILTFSLISKT
jgi:hypothetical protein